jgi:hypothetical protein
MGLPVRSTRLFASWLIAAAVLMSQDLAAQSISPFVFTISPVDAGSPDRQTQVGAGIADRGLELVQNGTFDPGLSVGVRVRNNLVVRSVASTVDVVSGGQRFANFQQVEILQSVRAGHAWSFAYGGGVREEWGGSQVAVARVLGSASLGSSRIGGSLVLERGLGRGRDGFGRRRDNVDMVTTLGVVRPVSQRVALGVEGVGRDLEGFWQPNEVDGGAKLLIGPALHVTPRNTRWVASVTGGPMIHSAAPGVAPNPTANGTLSGHFAVLGSFTYVGLGR